MTVTDYDEWLKKIFCSSLHAKHPVVNGRVVNIALVKPVSQHTFNFRLSVLKKFWDYMLMFMAVSTAEQS